MEKNIGKIKTILEDIEGNGTYIKLDADELKQMGLKMGDWIKWFVNDDGNISFEKATNEEVIEQL